MSRQTGGGVKWSIKRKMHSDIAHAEPYPIWVVYPPGVRPSVRAFSWRAAMDYVSRSQRNPLPYLSPNARAVCRDLLSLSAVAAGAAVSGESKGQG